MKSQLYRPILPDSTSVRSTLPLVLTIGLFVVSLKGQPASLQIQPDRGKSPSQSWIDLNFDPPPNGAPDDRQDAGSRCTDSN